MTINRDIETLNAAGIPIVTFQGANGGIGIMENYRIDKTLLTSSDMQAILAGLLSLDSVSGTNKYQQLKEKLSPKGRNELALNRHILIDLSSWHKSTLVPKIELIQAAIERKEKITFRYFAPKGVSQRKIEPYFLIFHWASWYVWGYCVDKSDFRLFKLTRMQEEEGTGELYEPRKVPQPELSAYNIFPSTGMIQAVFEPEMRWRLMEDFGMDCFREQEDGTLLFTYEFMDKESLFGWLLSFGSAVELLGPEEIRQEFALHIKKISEKYVRQEGT